MHQDWDETIHNFGAPLRGQASICKFLIKCPGCNMDVNYTENILRDVVTHGLADSEIQLDLLGEKNQDMTLEEVFQFIEAKETGKRSAGRLLETQGAEATRSQYRCANRRTSRTTKFTTKVLLLQETRPWQKSPCAHCCCPNHLQTVCFGKTKPSFLPHGMPLPEKLRMPSLMPSALPLVSARAKMDI